jgi:hypothetical protein
MSFCGVGAHHQNGVAEKKIRDIQEAARTMMLHASICWPASQSVSMWPYAIRVAVDVMNSTPREDGVKMSPLQNFTGSNALPRLKDFHTFGCPVYVQNEPLQTGKSQSKWLSRARLGIYLGMSPKHARSVALVLNPRTGLVSPQWHLKFDDKFETVIMSMDVTHRYWKKVAGFVTMGHTQVRDDVAHKVTSTTTTTMATDRSIAQPDNSSHSNRTMATEEYNLMGPSEGASVPTELELDFGMGTNGEEMSFEPMDFGTTLDDDTVIPSRQGNAPTLRRSNRQRIPSWKVRENADRGDVALPAAYEVLAAYFEKDIADEMMDPIAFLAKTDPDTLYYHQAMKATDAKHFRKAMQGELNDHNNRKH